MADVKWILECQDKGTYDALVKIKQEFDEVGVKANEAGTKARQHADSAKSMSDNISSSLTGMVSGFAAGIVSLETVKRLWSEISQQIDTAGEKSATYADNLKKAAGGDPKVAAAMQPVVEGMMEKFKITNVQATDIISGIRKGAPNMSNIDLAAGALQVARTEDFGGDLRQQGELFGLLKTRQGSNLSNEQANALALELTRQAGGDVGKLTSPKGIGGFDELSGIGKTFGETSSLISAALQAKESPSIFESVIGSLGKQLEMPSPGKLSHAGTPEDAEKRRLAQRLNAMSMEEKFDLAMAGDPGVLKAYGLESQKESFRSISGKYGGASGAISTSLEKGYISGQLKEFGAVDILAQGDEREEAIAEQERGQYVGARREKERARALLAEQRKGALSVAVGEGRKGVVRSKAEEAEIEAKKVAGETGGDLISDVVKQIVLGPMSDFSNALTKCTDSLRGTRVAVDVPGGS